MADTIVVFVLTRHWVLGASYDCCMADTIVVFVLTRHWVLGASYDCPRQVPGAWSHHPHWRCGICCRSVAFDYSAANMSRNSAVLLP